MHVKAMAVMVVGGLGLFATACAEDGGAVEGAGTGEETMPAAGHEDSVEFRDATEGLPGTYAQVCPGWRQIAVRKPGTGPCPASIAAPDGSTWLGGPMFPLWTESTYKSFCAYEIHGAFSPGNATSFQSHPDFLRSASDCIVNGPQSLEDEIYPPLRELVADRADAIPAGDLQSTVNSRTLTRVTVVDTVPNVVQGGPPRDDHGVVVADLIKEFTDGCAAASPTCKVVVENYLALPRFGFGQAQKDPERGGFVGSQYDVLMGVYDSLVAWEQQPSPRPKHVINFSVGWLPFFNNAPNLGNAMSPAVEALGVAMERANCRGALLIAAAGNEQHDCEGGPLSPAFWEERVAPTPARCNLLGIGGVAAPPANSYNPLVFSVGGLDYNDDAVSVSRVGGRPRLAAIADHVVFTLGNHSARHGTSMSAALVSAMAANIWSYKPNLTARAVMQTIYDGALPTGDSADYTVAGWGGATEIRRATLCRSLQTACQSGGCPVGLAADCIGPNDTPLPLDDLHAAIDDAAIDPPNASIELVESSVDCPLYCEPGLVSAWKKAGGADPVCEVETEGMTKVDFITEPQPFNPACPACAITVNENATPNGTYSGFLTASLATGYTSSPDAKEVITAYDALGNSKPLELGDLNLTASTSTTPINGLPFLPTRVTLLITFANGKSADGDILLRIDP